MRYIERRGKNLIRWVRWGEEGGKVGREGGGEGREGGGEGREVRWGGEGRGRKLQLGFTLCGWGGEGRV